MTSDGRVQPIRVVGRYAMYREIASGGMAAVHIGRLVGPVGFARTVAIKRLHPQFAKDPEFVGMFLDEARLVSRIRHPNVVQTIDVVPLEGELFLVMDFVHGESLSRLTKATAALGTKVPTKIAAAVMASVLHGLHAAHEAKDAAGRMLGIVHRDVSPHNIMVGTDGVARVLDFGVAFAAGRVQSTREGQIKGKIAYMSPEQLNGDPVDRLTDVYAASVVLWELLTGKRLFDADNQGQILNRVLTGNIDPPSKHAPQLAPAIEEVVMRGLARDRSQRWSTAREMAVAIERSAGVATPSMVGGWVETVAGDVLADRAAHLALIEHSSISEDELTPSHIASQMILSSQADAGARPSALPSNHSPSTHSLQVSTVELEQARRRSAHSLAPGGASKRTHVVLAIAASCALGVLLGAFVLAGGPPKDAGAGTAAARGGATALSALPPAATVVSNEAPLAPADASAPRAPTTGTSALPEAPVNVPATKTPELAKSVASPKASAKAVDCNPPFTFDGAGHKKYKLECL